jgi:hypothetical protein
MRFIIVGTMYTHLAAVVLDGGERGLRVEARQHHHAVAVQQPCTDQISGPLWYSGPGMIIGPAARR